MKNQIYTKLFLAIILVAMMSAFVSAEVLVMNLNSVQYTSGESAKVFGYLLDNNYDGLNYTTVNFYLDGGSVGSEVTSSDGYYERYFTNLTAGNHTLIANTTSSEQTLTFTVFPAAQIPSYQIIASSLVARYSNPTISFTVKKYLGTTLTNETYSYKIYYENGTLYSTDSGVSNALEPANLPSQVGLYTIVVDNKKSFTVSVAQFTLKFKIADQSGNQKYTFKPNGIAYFQVEGFSNGQKISNATVTARVKDSTGTTKTVTFTESTTGLYKGNTNVTQTTPIQLRAGDYEVEFNMKDSSNNEQKINGFFTVLGLNVEVSLLNKKSYRADDTAEFDVLVKNLENGNLVAHNSTTYFLELEKDGKFYDISTIVKSESDKPTLSSKLEFTIPESLEDGNYFLNVKAKSSGKTGSGKEYFEVMNTEVFIELTDNFGGFRDMFQPGEMAKISAFSPDATLQLLSLRVENKNGVVQTTSNATLNASSGVLSFNVPSTMGEYIAKITVTTSSDLTITRQLWFSVQNYFSFLDVKNLDNQFQFMMASDENFLGEINVFDIAKGQSVDLTGFVIKFDKITNEETRSEYTNIQTVENSTYSERTAGRVSFNINPPALDNGFYKIEYTMIDSKGKSIKGNGWFGISAFDVQVNTYDTSGQQKEIFSAGKTINVSVQLSIVENGTATIHREFFNPKSFSITNGRGSTLLSASQN